MPNLSKGTRHWGNLPGTIASYQFPILDLSSYKSAITVQLRADRMDKFGHFPIVARSTSDVDPVSACAAVESAFAALDELEHGSDEFEQCINLIVNAFLCRPLTAFLVERDYPSVLASRLPLCRDVKEVRVILFALAFFFNRNPQLLPLETLQRALDMFFQFSPARLGRFGDSEAILVLLLLIIAAGLYPDSRGLFGPDFYSSLVAYSGIIPEVDVRIAEIVALSARHFLDDPAVVRVCVDFFAARSDMNIAPALADLFVSFATSAPDVLLDERVLGAYRQLRRFQHVAKPVFRALRRVEAPEILARGYFDDTLAGVLADCLQSPDLAACTSAALRTIGHLTRVDSARSLRFFLRTGALYCVVPLIFPLIHRGAFKEKAGAAMLFADIVGMAESPLRDELAGRMTDIVRAISSRSIRMNSGLWGS